MDKALLVITEHFASETREEQAAGLQRAVDRYLSLAMKDSGLKPPREVDGP